MKINLGCGRHVLDDGWLNVDAQQSPKAKRAPELLFALRFDDAGALIERIPLADGCAEQLMAIHFFEHLYLWQTEALIAEIHRLLQPNGLLILELPNIVKCAQNIVNGTGMEAGGKHPDALGLWGLYGDPGHKDAYMCHHWGWSPQTLRKFLHAHGFHGAEEKVTQWHPGGRANRDMRMEARRD